MTEATQKTNYEIFIETINSLRYSQGFYSRVARNVESLTDEGREQVKRELNAKPQWHDTLDCVLFLEQ